jgi:hypothetical protein
MSFLQEPQPVPARQAAPTASTESQPPATQAAIAPSVTRLQLQTIRSAGSEGAEIIVGTSASSGSVGSASPRSNICTSDAAAAVLPTSIALTSLPSRMTSLR